MPSTIAMEKTRLRVDIRKCLNDMPIARMQAGDAAMFRTLLDLPEVERANMISLFWGVTGLEPDTSRLAAALLEHGKAVCVPRMIPHYGMELRRYTPGAPMAYNAFGILEPTLACPLVEKEEIDLVVVPALCYDRAGHRLGYGGGYYDRWLSDYTGVTVGMCREEVLQQHLPAEEHDRPVGIVVTEHQVLRFSAN